MTHYTITYPYGSQIYGTADEHSDRDYIVVDSSSNFCEIQSSDATTTTYTPRRFQELIDAHEISVLECIFLPDDKICQKFIDDDGMEFQEPIHFPPSSSFILDLNKLRISLSAKSSNSWVKAKKKIDQHQEYRLGRKSLFHALRILNFGLQIAERGRIVDYSASNHYLRKIQEQGFDSWQPYKDYWQPIFNELKTQFRFVAPKE
jgi:hypothetical protein